MRGPGAEEEQHVSTALITGATDGIGRETARGLLKLGWRVLVHGRHAARAQAAVAALAPAAGSAVPVWGDLADLAQVRSLAAQVGELAPDLAVLVNNAGVYCRQRAVSADGHELSFAVNYLAPVLLTRLLLPLLTATGGARVVNVASGTHESARLDLDDPELDRGWDAYLAYSNSKLGNVLFSNALAARYAPAVLASNALHPGVIATKLLKVGFGAGGAPLSEGAKTSLYVATSPALAGVTGRYFSDCRARTPSRRAQDRDFGEALWLRTEAMLAPWLDPIRARAADAARI